MTKSVDNSEIAKPNESTEVEHSVKNGEKAQSEDLWNGYYISTIFCASHIVIFPVTMVLVLYFVQGDPAASEFGDEPRLKE